MSGKTIDFNEFTVKKYVESLRPEDLEIRTELDIGYSNDGKTIILFEIRTDWMDSEKKIQIEFAKIRYYKTKKKWSLYWMTGDLKWKLYAPFPESTHLDKIFSIIKEDKNCCFFG